MTAPRRTQQERSAATRARILDAAFACLLDGGYGATTVGAVQARAGVARGTLLHHFPTRSDLMAGVVEDIIDRRLAGLTQASSAERGPTWDELVDVIWQGLQSPPFAAALDLWVAARTDDDLRAALAPLQTRLFATVHRDITGLIGSDHPRSNMLVQFTIDLLTGSRLGSILQPRPGAASVVEAWKVAVRELAALDAPD